MQLRAFTGNMSPERLPCLKRSTSATIDMKHKTVAPIKGKSSNRLLINIGKFTNKNTFNSQRVDFSSQTLNTIFNHYICSYIIITDPIFKLVVRHLCL